MSWHLVLDTSTSRPVVVLAKDDEVRAHWLGPATKHHSETLLAGIDECLKQNKISLADLNAVAAGVGPGMFTGLRIGIATAQFLAELNQVPAIRFSSLLAQGLGMEGQGRLWVLGDAKSKRVYSLLLSPEQRNPLHAPQESEELALTPEELAPSLRAGDLLCGEGAQLYRDLWPAGTQVLEAESYFNPAAMASLANSLFLAKRTVSALELQPRYLKTGQAHLP